MVNRRRSTKCGGYQQRPIKSRSDWPMLASALNLQLGWGAKWKVGAGRKPDRNCHDLADFGMPPNSLLFAPV